MIDYERIAEEIAENITGMTTEEKEDLYNDENYCREHLVPESYELSEEYGDEFNFSISDIHWFNDFESSEEWEEGEKFDGDKLAFELEKIISGVEDCEWDNEYFTVRL